MSENKINPASVPNVMRALAMKAASVVPNRNDLLSIQFSGSPPPPPEPVPAPVRRDSLGRKIHPTVLEALKMHQFKPGQSGNPGGHRRRQREMALDCITHLLMIGKIQPSSTVADLMNALHDEDFRALDREKQEVFPGDRKARACPEKVGHAASSEALSALSAQRAPIILQGIRNPRRPAGNRIVIACPSTKPPRARAPTTRKPLPNQSAIRRREKPSLPAAILTDVATPSERGNALESAVAAIESHILDTSPALREKTFFIEGKKIITVDGVHHEIDIYVTIDLGVGYTSVFIFECKNWQDPVGKNEVIVLSEKIDATQAQHGYLIGKSFTKDAQAQALKDPTRDSVGRNRARPDNGVAA